MHRHGALELHAARHRRHRQRRHSCGASSLDYGIYVSHPGATVANNVYGNAGYGIHCWHNCNHLVVSHNLVFDNGEGGILIGQGDDPNNGQVAADNFVVSDNIAVSNGKHGIAESGATGPNNRYLHNIVSGNAEKGLGAYARENKKGPRSVISLSPPIHRIDYPEIAPDTLGSHTFP